MSPWIPWLYQYGVGGAVFGVSVWLAWRSGAAQGRASDRWTLRALSLALGSYALIHALWIAKVTP